MIVQAFVKTKMLDILGRSLAVRKTPKLRETYSQRFLFNELLPAAKRCDDTAYAKFHIESLNHLIENFNISGIVASIQKFSLNGSLVKFEFRSTYNVASIGKDIYLRVSSCDRIKDLSLKYPGVAILNSDIMPLDDWLDTEIYHHLKLPLGVHQSATLMYNLLFKSSYKFKIVYYSDMSRTFDPAITSDEIEFLSLPFFLGWLCRANVIDSHTLNDYFKLLVGMTPMRLALLREIVNTGRYQNAAIAARLHVSDRVVRNYITDAYGAIAHLLPDPDVAWANTSPCVDLVRCYDFLKLAGPGGVSADRELEVNL